MQRCSDGVFRLCGGVNLIDHFFESHGVLIFSTSGCFLLLAGYLGLHWIGRRRFYRRKLRDPFASYFEAWFTGLVEGNIWLLSLLSAMLGCLFLFVAVIDWIDG